jgi:outer membrane protein assembly factor BamB
MLNVLDGRDGTVIWARNAASDIGAEIPTWGFSGSPVVVDDVVVTALQGVLVAYDRETGEPRWTGSDGGDGYSSPHLLTIDGAEQVLLASRNDIVSYSPSDGERLWLHDWKGGTRIVQPAEIGGGDLLISQGTTSGIRRLAVARGSAEWSAEERWTSNRLKPYFSDFVIHERNAYGFDGNILASIELEAGERNWKGGRYGSGQLVLLAEQDLLLVISEKGELALVSATPERFTELARFPALTGKTWNHPVVVGNLLLVRNAVEMAAFRLPVVGG